MINVDSGVANQAVDWQLDALDAEVAERLSSAMVVA
jgi:hypothetical protein